ncbi:MAG: heat-shock protein Hsp20 [Chloroflexi bacterium]|nr:MAG: heat-shock protein Hsp20 [Chloroflexota bacterium]
MYVVRRRGSFPRERIQVGMEDAFRSALMSGRPLQTRSEHGSAPAWRPPIDVYETNDALIVLAEIAGLSEAAFEVSIDDATLSISGERLPACDDERRSTHEMNLSYGPFAADVYLPFAVDPQAVTATYERGLLKVTLPRLAGTRIHVNTARQGSAAALADSER